MSDSFSGNIESLPFAFYGEDPEAGVYKEGFDFSLDNHDGIVAAWVE